MTGKAVPKVAVEQATVEQIENALGALIRIARTPRFAELIHRRAGAEVDRAGYAVLVRIAELAPVRLSDLAHHLGLDISTVSRQVQQLEQRGLVARHADPDDGRAVRLELSARGQATTEKLREAWCSTVSHPLDGWKPADVARFAALIDRFVSDLAKSVDG